jgi:hypothetical protein
MARITRGFHAGLIATLAMSLFMVMQMSFGLMPQVDIIRTLAEIMGSSQVAAWLVHFVVGTVLFGGTFAIAYGRVPGATSIGKGLSFATIVWLLMMLLVMPVMGAGFFGWTLGLIFPVATLALQLVYGFVLGGIFAEVRQTYDLRIPETDPELWWRR